MGTGYGPRGQETRELLLQLYEALEERDSLRRAVEEYRRYVESGVDGLSRLDRRFMAEGRRAAFAKGWSNTYTSRTAKTYDGRTMTVEEYAARNVGEPPEWMSREEFVHAFASEIREAYEAALEEDEEAES